MGFGGSSSQTIGFQYSMSIHMALGRGPVDQLVEIDIGDKMAWPIPGGAPVPMRGAHPADTKPGTTTNPVDGVGGGWADGTGLSSFYSDFTPVYETKDIFINAPELFGGDKQEGGVQGKLSFMMGLKTQIVPAWVKRIIGGDVPEFRGVVTAFFDGMICAMNPYPKTWRFRVRRALAGWDGPVWHPELARIILNDGAIHAMNPAHIIYEAATNRDWGRGKDRSRVDEASFLLAAQTLYNEGFGLCLRYNREDDLDVFVETIINHIAGAVYTSRETGLITLDLIRDDYDVASLPFFDYSSGLLSIEEAEASSRDDNVNEVIVNYHDPIRHEDRSIRAQNLASRQSTGVTNSSTVGYPGIPTGTLAGQVATRDLRVASTSGRRFNVNLDRAAWRLVPGKAFVVSAPDKGIERLILRAGAVDQKWITEGTIKVIAVPDVFGMPLTSFTTPVETGWKPPDRDPKQITRRLVREATYRDLFMNLNRSEFAQIGSDEAYVCGLGARPSSNTMDFKLASRTSVEVDFADRDAGTFPPVLQLSASVSVTGNTIQFTVISDADQIRTPCAAQIDGEIVRVNSVTMLEDGTSGVMNVARGCVDTFPEAHAIGATVFFFDTHFAYDGREYAKSEEVIVKLLSRTSTGTLPYNFALNDSVVVTARQGLPYPATNVTVNGVSIFSTTPRREDVVISWNHRNKVIQQDKLIGYFENSFDVESGVSYTIKISYDGDVVRTVTGLTANTFTYTKAMGVTDKVPAGAPITFSLDTVKGSAKALKSSTKTVLRS